MRDNKRSIVVVVFLALLLVFSGSLFTPEKAMAYTVPTYQIDKNAEKIQGKTDPLTGKAIPSVNSSDKNAVCDQLGLSHWITSPIDWLMCGIAKFMQNYVIEKIKALECGLQGAGIVQYNPSAKIHYDFTNKKCVIIQ
jgi:hypothetical protein